MTKRYRDEKGELTISIGQIAKETADEAAKYYQIGGIYLNATNGEEEVFEPLKREDVFKNPIIDHGVVTWNDGNIDCAPEFMYNNSYEYSMVI